MNLLLRGMVIDVNLEPVKGSETGKIRPCIVITNNTYNARVPVVQVIPVTEWSEKKARILTNCVLEPTAENGLEKRSVADCLQTRPIDWKSRFVRLRGHLSDSEIKALEKALRLVFALE